MNKILNHIPFLKKQQKKIILLSLLPLAAQAQQVDTRPNIVLFMVDDMGWQDTSLPFWTEKTPLNNLYETPNMERLAQQGMMFTQAYASSISSPTRCSLLSGMNAARHRVTNWTLEKNKSTDRQSETLEFPDWNVNGLTQIPNIERTTHITSFVQLLKNSGYHTIHCGKAHFGALGTSGENPTHFGFEVNIAGHAAGGLASYLGEENYGNRTDGNPSPLNAIPNLEKYHGTETFATEALTIEALNALDKAKEYNQPFFLYMSHYAVHIPIQKDKRFYQKYIEKGMNPVEAAYASLIEGMDKSLGDIMNWLEANGKAENTIVIFMSDNGGLAACNNRNGTPHTQNAPLNSGKGSAYEGGIREPMIVAWQGNVKPQSKCNDYLIIEDFFPTILEMAEVKDYKTVQEIDGKSFMPLLTGVGKNPTKNRSLYWNCPNLWGCVGPGIGPTCTIRSGNWKLVYDYETGKKELFNISEDIGERNNLATQNAKIVNKLSKKLGNYLRKVGAQRPAFKANGKLCPFPDEIE